MKVFTYKGACVKVFQGSYINGTLALQIKDLDGFPIMRASIYDHTKELKENEVAVDILNYPDLLRFLFSNNIASPAYAIFEKYNMFYPIVSMNPESEWINYTEMTEDETELLTLKCA